MELERSLSAASDIFEDAEEGLEMDEEFSEASEPASLGDDEDSQVKQFLLNMIKKHCMKTPVFVGAKTDQVSHTFCHNKAIISQPPTGFPLFSAE